MTDDIKIAAVAHEANRAWCEANGDNSQSDWGSAPQWQRDSAIKGVEFHRANPDAPYSASHESWMAQKVKDGWVYGAEKCAEAKTHPCMVPYDELPEVQRKKDALFTNVVRSLV